MVLLRYFLIAILFGLALTGCGGSSSRSASHEAEVSDSDGDGVPDTEDAFPFNSHETKDSDGDSVGDNADSFPNDPTETADYDNDSVGNNADAFPNDPTETQDSDADGVGDNADQFPDNEKIAFTQSFVVDGYQTNLTVGERIHLVVMEENGPGAIKYDSSDASVVSINSMGDIEGLGLGNTKITVTKESTGLWQESIAEFQISVAKQNIELMGWLGREQSELSLNSEAQGMDIIRTQDANCNASTLSTCDSVESDIFLSKPINDTVMRYFNRSYVTVSNEIASTTTKMLDYSKFIGRADSELVEFNNELILIGGHNDELRNDIWRSEDGIRWRLESITSNFSPRYGHKVVEFQGELWLIGGADRNGLQYGNNDIWKSSNGIDWQFVKRGEFEPRVYHQTVVFDDKIWLFGGISNNAIQFGNEIWVSENGSNWKLITPEFDLSPTTKVEVFNNSLWIISQDSETGNDQLYSSTDGVSWLLHSSDRLRADLLVRYDNKLLVRASGHELLTYDGASWGSLPLPYDLNRRNGFEAVKFMEKLFIITGDFYSQIWSLNKSGQWTSHSPTPILHESIKPNRTVIFEDKIWYIAGNIYSSANGLNWKYEGYEWNTDRYSDGHAVVLNDRIFVILESENSDNNLISASQDGLNWETVNDNPKFGPSRNFEVASFKNKIFVIGLREQELDGSTLDYVDIWFSEDGLDWSQDSSTTAIPALTHMKTAEYNDKLWLIGIRLDKTEVWSSVDGINWQLVTDDPGFNTRKDFDIEVYDDQLMILGGADLFNDNYVSDVWASPDGLSWQLLKDHAYIGRNKGAIVNFNQELYLLGGERSWKRNPLYDVWKTGPNMIWKRGLRESLVLELK